MKKETTKHKFTKEELAKLIEKLGGEYAPTVELPSGEKAPLFPKFITGFVNKWRDKEEMYKFDIKELHIVFKYLLSTVN